MRKTTMLLASLALALSLGASAEEPAFKDLHDRWRDAWEGLTPVHVLVPPQPRSFDALENERPEEGVEGTVTIGFHETDLDGSRDRAAEYRTLDDSVNLNFDFLGPIGDDGLVAFNGAYWDEDEQSYALRVDGERFIRVEADYLSFVHNLEHDPLTNLEAVNELKIVRHTDFDPDEAYSIRYSDARVGAKIKSRSVPGLYYGVEVREQHRDGMRQALTTGHCFSCHIVSKSREVDELTRDLSLYLGIEKERWDLSYKFTGRTYDENGDTPTVVYDNAFRPNNPDLRVFEDRMQYDDDEGPLIYDRVPESEKQTHVLKGHYTSPGGNRFSGALVHSRVKNNDTDVETRYDSGRLRYFRAWREGKTDLTVGYRHERVRTDDYFVDVAERVAIAGPGFYQGNTYEEMYGPDGVNGSRGFVADFTRKSALNRKTDQGRVSLRFRFPKRHTLRLDLRHRNVDRDHFVVNDAGSTSTAETRFKAVFYGRPNSYLRYRLEASLLDVSRPFANVNGGCQTDATSVYGSPGIAPSPLAPPSRQYYELHDLRRADLTNVPTTVGTFRTNVTVTVSPRLAFTFTGKLFDKENNDTGAQDWQHDSMMLGLNAWFAPVRSFYGTVSYTNNQDEFTSQVCVPIMDG
jgi:hypothetical protein